MQLYEAQKCSPASETTESRDLKTPKTDSHLRSSLNVGVSLSLQMALLHNV